ncbi:hypothetical protein [Pseudoflavitalea rhizosphaerae]|uniref:hypothetical protein n=1 Tax=Pseudoflavitalea rhizosphaerae TaxID=1884793 RepID=UPI000F8D8E77|nr:hypothetical protein [Pseudoflavitalea rhizosphaerae]
MSRLKQNRIIDNAIESIVFITQSQSSLSECDEKLVTEALNRLQALKRKKGKTNGQIQKEIVDIILLLIKFFSK